MAITKTDIIASAVVVLSLVVLFIIDGIIPFFYGPEPPKTVYPAATSVAALICFAIFCLHFRRAPTLRCKMLIVGVFLSSVGAILSLCFLPSPPGWYFEFHMMLCIDTVSMVVFLLGLFVDDKKITILLALFVNSLVLIYFNLESLDQLFPSIFSVVLSIVIYLVLLIIYVKHISNKWWKVAVITISVSAIIVVVRLFGIKWQILFFLITSINSCSSLFLALLIYAQKSWHEEMLQNDQYNFLEMAGLPARFTIKELETATGNFQTPIGEGGSGAVFKGTMVDGSIVAVKHIKGQASGEAEFRTEITIIASLQHVSLVRLLGYCLSRRGDRYLVYTFFENGSLDAWLFKNEEKRAHLTWMHRYCIASDVANALAYLHHECHHQILHLDIKPANILLDSSFRALLSDFCISKSIGKDESSIMTRARGTVMLIDGHLSMFCNYNHINLT